MLLAWSLPTRPPIGPKTEEAAHKMGVKRLAIHHPSTKSTEWRALQKKRWFRQAQAWRTGSEGRISVVKRRHGLNRWRYRGDAGMKRWVGLGVIADNLINFGRVMAGQGVKGDHGRNRTHFDRFRAFHFPRCNVVRTRYTVPARRPDYFCAGK